MWIFEISVAGAWLFACACAIARSVTGAAMIVAFIFAAALSIYGLS